MKFAHCDMLALLPCFKSCEITDPCPTFRAILDKISDSWTSLLETCQHKKQKLEEAYNEMLYNRGVSDLENWLAEIEVGIGVKLFIFLQG